VITSDEGWRGVSSDATGNGGSGGSGGGGGGGGGGGHSVK